MRRRLTHPNKFINGFWRFQHNYEDWYCLMVKDPGWWNHSCPGRQDMIRNSQLMFWNHINLSWEKQWKHW